MSRTLEIGIVNYGMGNVMSVKNALEHIGNNMATIVSSPTEIELCDCLILPGVGAFRDAMKNLEERNLVNALTEHVVQKQKILLAICLGMQLLMEVSEEGGKNKGLGWINGRVRRFTIDNSYRVPHVGWNDIRFKETSSFFNGIAQESDFYFDHSYHVECDDSHVIATCDYGYKFAVAIQKENVVGVQFHPEKSHYDGLLLLRNFLDFARGAAGC